LFLTLRRALLAHQAARGPRLRWECREGVGPLPGL